MSYLCHQLSFRDSACEHMYLEFEKLGHVVQHGLQGNIVNNIKNESTKANDPSHSYFVEVALLHKKITMLPALPQNLTLQEAFGTPALKNEAQKEQN